LIHKKAFKELKKCEIGAETLESGENRFLVFIILAKQWRWRRLLLHASRCRSCVRGCHVELGCELRVGACVGAFVGRGDCRSEPVSACVQGVSGRWWWSTQDSALLGRHPPPSAQQQPTSVYARVYGDDLGRAILRHSNFGRAVGRPRTGRVQPSVRSRPPLSPDARPGSSRWASPSQQQQPSAAAQPPWAASDVSADAVRCPRAHGGVPGRRLCGRPGQAARRLAQATPHHG
jgi:hypothetical protein